MWRTKAEIYSEKIIEIASDLIGKPSIRYVRGHPKLGQSPTEGFDCSGFVGYVLRKVGLNIPDYIGQDGEARPIRHANEFWDHYGVTVDSQSYVSGDLICFSRNGKFPTHIGIVRDKESYIHAPGKDGTKVEIATIAFESIKRRYGNERILYQANPIGFKAPTVPLATPSPRYHQQPIE